MNMRMPIRQRARQRLAQELAAIARASHQIRALDAEDAPAASPAEQDKHHG